MRKSILYGLLALAPYLSFTEARAEEERGFFRNLGSLLNPVSLCKEMIDAPVEPKTSRITRRLEIVAEQSYKIEGDMERKVLYNPLFRTPDEIGEEVESIAHRGFEKGGLDYLEGTPAGEVVAERWEELEDAFDVKINLPFPEGFKEWIYDIRFGKLWSSQAEHDLIAGLSVDTKSWSPDLELDFSFPRLAELALTRELEVSVDRHGDIKAKAEKDFFRTNLELSARYKRNGDSSFELDLWRRSIGNGGLRVILFNRQGEEKEYGGGIVYGRLY